MINQLKHNNIKVLQRNQKTFFMPTLINNKNNIT